MKRALIAMLVFACACARVVSFQEYREPGGEFSAEVPSGWHLDERGPFSKKPVGEVWWVGKVVDDHEGWPIGALLFVRKLDRNPDKRNKVYIEELRATEALFTGTHPSDVKTSAVTLAGLSGRSFVRDYEEKLGGGMHGKVRTYPTRVSGVVLEAPAAYYVLEYRATKELFDKYLPAFERLKATFKLTK